MWLPGWPQLQAAPLVQPLSEALGSQTGICFPSLLCYWAESDNRLLALLLELSHFSFILFVDHRVLISSVAHRLALNITPFFTKNIPSALLAFLQILLPTQAR